MGEKLNSSSYLFGNNSVFVEELYERYLINPESVDKSWQDIFSDFKNENSPKIDISNAASWASKTVKIIGVKDETEAPKKDGSTKDLAALNLLQTTAKARKMIESYRQNGHLESKLDPLNIEKIISEQKIGLDYQSFGFSEKDLDQVIQIDNELLGVEKASLREVIEILKATYSSHIGVEYMHIQDAEQRKWIENKVESLIYEPAFSKEKKEAIMRDILGIEGFEQFLHVKFPGTKRFSVEGGENAIVGFEAIISTLANHKVEEIVIGMPHRGRLNVLTKVMGKPYAAMLSEFMGNPAHPSDLDVSGDVKYHMGTSSDVALNGQNMHLSLTANPSHLEAVNPVVAGKVRAKQDNKKDLERRKVVGILLHGDAAFAGQGVVAETLSLGELDGYKTGGTIHIIVNNQIGFTTSPKKARASRYPSEFGKIVQAPIFHVNGDDPEAVIKAARIAAEFQQAFQKEVILDVICYRLHGHNENDEPMFTQPVMYKEIKQHKTPSIVYTDMLKAEGNITDERYQELKQEWKSFFEKELKIAENYKPNKVDWLAGKWQGLKRDKASTHHGNEKTGVELKKLKELGLAISAKPENVAVNSKIIRLLDTRRKMVDEGKDIDWGMGEALAYASLVDEGIRVRLSGQDCGRGTFSHRQSVIVDQDTDATYVPLNNISKNQAEYEVIDSNLSEFAVLGFEYGYSTVEPNSLTIWEAQFGDFANGAQVMFDQFISGGESKWLRMSGLVMLLPHGYEGQGPEHSSARLERFLQLCGDNNMQITNITTPANFFHALRRQICRDFRKPLVVMSPKSLLRSKRAVSELKDMQTGTKFQTVIGEHEKLSNVTRVVVCSGKVYYDLLEARETRKINNIALIRLEQFYPFPEAEITKELEKYPNAESIWCQEEPENMGGWHFVDRRIEKVLATIKAKYSRPSYVGRPASASTAAGYGKTHDKEQAKLIDQALTVNK